MTDERERIWKDAVVAKSQEPSQRLDLRYGKVKSEEYRLVIGAGRGTWSSIHRVQFALGGAAV